MEGVLLPAESAKFVCENGDLIKINEEGVKSVANLIVEAVKNGTIKEVEFAAHVLHPKDGGLHAVNWVFLMDTINFFFWPDEGSKYDVSYKGTTYTGYFAGCAAVNKALDAGMNVVDPKWMATATEEEIDSIFKADSGSSIPLLAERVKAINESGRVVLEKFDGSFFNCVKAADGSAMKLLQIIVDNFESFRDFAEFKGTKVSLLKRAQILVADIYGALKDIDPIGEFADIGKLTMFADYRVPQALAYLGALDYSPALLDLLGEGKRLENGSSAEVQLRAASIWACEMSFKKFEDKEDITGNTQLKTSMQKAIRNKLIGNYPHLEPHLPDIFPKKENFKLVKCKDHIELLADHNGVVQFVKTRNTEFVPTLRLLHKYPFILPLQQVDKGAIRFLLNGSSIMCPGLTSPGAKMTPGVPVNTIVAIMAEGKEHAIAVGQMKMSSEEIAQVNKGIGIETVVYLNDGLWRLAEKPV